MKQRERSVRGLAAFGLVVFLTVYAMAAVPALHALAHDGARDARHECAVTLFSHGQVHCASVMVEWSWPVAVCIAAAPIPRAVFASADLRLLPSRGPPGVFFV